MAKLRLLLTIFLTLLITTNVRGEEYELVPFEDIQTGDVVIIVGTKSGTAYAMTNNGGTNTPPKPSKITISNGKITTETNTITFTVTKNNDGTLTFTTDGTNTLYCNNSNNGVRIGNNTNNTFSFDTSVNRLKNEGTARWLGIYSTQDWRCYNTSNADNIKETTTTFYKKVTSTGSPIPVTNVTLNKSSHTMMVGDIVQLSATITPSNATRPYVEWSSNNTSVATVSPTGLVTALSPGYATITVTTTDGNHTATCNITVRDVSSSEITWQLVKNANNLTIGDQIVIAAADFDQAISTHQNGNNRDKAAITKNGETITLGDKVQILTIEEGTQNNTFAFNTGNGYLYAASSSNNYLRTESTLSNNSSWKITISDSIATIVAQGANTHNIMQYNASNGLFSCYASASLGAISIYKKIIPGEEYGEDIIIRSGQTETFNEYKRINTLTIEGGATAIMTTDEIQINTLILQGGLNAEATNYSMPNLYINGTTLHVDKVYFDLSVNNQTFYPFAVPFAVSINHIDYADSDLASVSTYGTHYSIERYDGAKRAQSGVNKNENWVRVTTSETLQPGTGYIISAIQRRNTNTVAIRIPLILNIESDLSFNIHAHTGDAAKANPIQKGWNFIANPYLAKYNGRDITNAPAYASIPRHDFSAYDQMPLSTATLTPGYPFFVQMESDAVLNFATTGRHQAPAAVRSDANHQTLSATFHLIQENNQTTDHTSIILNEQYTPAYEINADLEKMFGSAYTTSLYSISNGNRLAFNAISFKDAQSPIPLGYRTAEAGEYTIALNQQEDTNIFEDIYDEISLYDSHTDTHTNLLYLDYTFNSEKTQDDTRFTIQFIPKNNTPTSIENIHHTPTTQKIIHNHQLYILHCGQLYNSVGQCIK